MSNINPDTFANLVITEAMDTVVGQVPAGDFPAYIKSQKLRQQKEHWLLDITWVVTDSAVAQELGRDEPTVRQSIFLDFTQEGALDLGKGKNVQLGKLREAVDQNQKGKPWSPGMLIGCSAIVNVQHRMDKNNNPQAEVRGVARG